MTDHSDRLERIEAKIDKLDDKVDGYQLAVEHRVSVLEVKGGIWGMLGGLVSSILLYFGLKH